MNIGRYAPSGQFTFIALSVLLSGGLIYGAEVYAHPAASTASISAAASPQQQSDSSNWEATLYTIEAENASSSLSAPAPQTVDEMLAAAQSSNVTDTVGKTILINLSNAKSQGLGDDVPTQDQIISDAAAQVAATKPAKQYTTADLTIVDDSPSSLKEYGNALVEAIDNHPTASEQATLTAIDNAIHNNDPSQLEQLQQIGAAYQAITLELLALPVPRTLSPLDLSIINSYATITASYADLEATLSDPLRGIVGIQTYEAQLDSQARVFTNIAQDLSKDGILFNKDEPGSAWSYFLSPQ